MTGEVPSVRIKTSPMHKHYVSFSKETCCQTNTAKQIGLLQIPIGFASSERCSTDMSWVCLILPLCCIPLKKWQGYMELFSRWGEIAFSMGKQLSMGGGKSLEEISGEDRRDAAGSRSSAVQAETAERRRKQPPRPQKEGKTLPRGYGGLAGFCTNQKSWACMDTMDRKGKIFIS